MRWIGRNASAERSKALNESALTNNRWIGGDLGRRLAAEGQDAVDDEERETAKRMLDYQYNGDAAAALRGAEIMKCSSMLFKALASTGKHGAQQMYDYSPKELLVAAAWQKRLPICRSIFTRGCSRWVRTPLIKWSNMVQIQLALASNKWLS